MRLIYIFRKWALSVIFCLFDVLLSAQILTPVQWTGKRVGDSVVAVAHVDSNWHFNIIAIGDSFFDVDPLVDKGFGDNYTITLPYDVAIRYVACDDEQCLSSQLWKYEDGEDTLKEDAFAEMQSVPSDDRNNLLIFLWGLLGGFLAIFTPCIWPIIPMTVSFFLKRQNGEKRGVRSAVFYGISIIVIYVSLGLVITLLFGASALNALSTNAVVNIFFFLLLVVFSLSFFGLFDITLPASWSTALDAKSRNAGGNLGILFMAFTLVVVSFSCTGPIIGTLLVEAAGKSLLSPMIGMLGFSIALALPFSLFALFPNIMRKMPKSGNWMSMFKITLAFIELALSLKFLSVADMAYGWGLLPRWLFIALWILCFGGLALYLFLQRRTLQSVYGKTIVLCLSLSSLLFSAYLLPGLWGRPVKAIAAFAPPKKENALFFLNYEKGLEQAKVQNKNAIIYFTGFGCVNCRKMDEFVIEDERVQNKLKEFVVVKLYVDDKRHLGNGSAQSIGDINSAIQRNMFGANAQPFYVRVDKFGKRIGQPMSFTTDVDKFLQWLNE